MNLKQRIFDRYRQGGFFGIIRKVFEVPFRWIKNVWMNIIFNLLPKRYFTFLGAPLPYLYHRYNTTWENERIVEIPIARATVARYQGKKILEIGNTLSHYFLFPHEIIDKYEIAPGVINEDIVDFNPGEKFDLIVSISTMEHVGWDEEIKDKEKILKSFLNLKEHCLAPGGKICVTMPLGYNPFLDELIKKNAIPFTKKYFLKRISRRNEWVELHSEESIESIRYGAPYRNANGIIVGIIAS